MNTCWKIVPLLKYWSYRCYPLSLSDCVHNKSSRAMYLSMLVAYNDRLYNRSLNTKLMLMSATLDPCDSTYYYIYSLFYRRSLLPWKDDQGWYKLDAAARCSRLTVYFDENYTWELLFGPSSVESLPPSLSCIGLLQLIFAHGNLRSESFFKILFVMFICCPVYKTHGTLLVVISMAWLALMLYAALIVVGQHIF